MDKRKYYHLKNKSSSYLVLFFLLLCLSSAGHTAYGGENKTASPNAAALSADHADFLNADTEEGDSSDEEEDEPADLNSLYKRGYDHGFDIGKDDGEYDADLSTESGERIYQLLHEDSLYYRIEDPQSAETDNEDIGYPESRIPVEEAEIPYYKKYALRWQEGYRDGYSYELNTGAVEDAYARGYHYGLIDARNDTYSRNKSHKGEDGESRQNGYYEPDYAESPYRTLEGTHGDAYRHGYDTGWADGLSGLSFGIDLSKAEYDAWRISTEPTAWTTAEKLFAENSTREENAFFNLDEEAFYTVSGDLVSGYAVACSPFAYFFAGEDNEILNQRLIDKKEDALNNNVNTLIADSENWLYKAFNIGDGIYLLVRYQVGNHYNYVNYEVQRYSYTRENGGKGKLKREIKLDKVNNYYLNEEPVVTYDGRKIEDTERKEKNGEVVQKKNTKRVRREISTDGMLVYWQEGQKAQALGEVKLRADVENNVNASVSGNYLKFYGDAFILGDEVEDGRRYYHLENSYSIDDRGEEKAVLGKAEFKSPSSIERLPVSANKAKKNDGYPYFSLRLYKLDKALKSYKKAIKKALNDPANILRFEIGRFRIDTDSTSELGFKPYTKGFSKHSDIAEKLHNMMPAAPRRRDYGSAEDFRKAADVYNEKMDTVDVYLASEEYKSAFRKELNNARDSYMKEYRALVDKYGKHMDEYAKYLEENVLPLYSPYTYVRKYTEDYYKDGNKDGLVSAIEQWEYDHIYGSDNLNSLDNYYFNGKFDPGENVVPDARAYQSLYGGSDELPDMEDVPWLYGNEYKASTTVYLNFFMNGEFDAANVHELEEKVALNEERFTYADDARFTLGGLKELKKGLKASPSFVYYLKESEEELADGVYKGLSRRGLKTRGKNAEIALIQKSSAGKQVLLIEGRGNLEGSIAVRKRPNGEAGYGKWISDEKHFIE